jgi:hypothetical protein
MDDLAIFFVCMTALLGWWIVFWYMDRKHGREYQLAMIRTRATYPGGIDTPHIADDAEDEDEDRVLGTEEDEQ